MAVCKTLYGTGNAQFNKKLILYSLDTKQLEPNFASLPVPYE